ncbi:Pirin-like protein [Cercospora beticola]|uniref:Pirin-like protein n=1 Tax=Cercospora beticola TaxID=122368 RepID=A0A2G5IB27_CERBT|nr:Pirin-like protein [Cercospora beticola]PIB01892.1 Pirin-like protein [Cercospora beticola]WPA96622.1 hypothetical protein RHO25_001229 [Cercospora beticola]CAK1355037.1 unnamed protein product [Cercospora beticola]
MRLFISILAIILAALTQIDSLNQYMRGILRAASNLSRPIRNNSSHFNTMANSKQWVGYPVIPPEDPSLNAANPTPRGISQVFEAREQAEGAGATVRRSIGTPKLRNFTPFLMLDHFKVDVGAGFPDHPHRGQETITYLLEGGVDHEDFTGKKGTLFPGDLQFMTAGRGVVHAEMPHDNGSGNAQSSVGLQLWVVI